MRETTAPPVPLLYERLVEALTEDTDPGAPFGDRTEHFLPALRPPGPRTLRTHNEYQEARKAEHMLVCEPPIELTLDVGAWVPDRLLDDEDTIIVDINTIIAGGRLIR